MLAAPIVAHLPRRSKPARTVPAQVASVATTTQFGDLGGGWSDTQLDAQQPEQQPERTPD
ncbi:TPA: hypothetical protein QDC22_005161 [Burkholderia stabilis]|uniref:hypothetical protein n=1 Tax=Burkholderia stabilis TaxID=95485 RepID=UPI00158BC5A7|nr:hypothetical protein [Burkholderia stabilis]HDR9583240.1 hypothetical protein [Burkholderia stabilis]HDR9651274.1 hypothetical protein [Burkholderia stabilis]HDR9681462.1 hypothetical protein [Burkholderia stabilis]